MVAERGIVGRIEPRDLARRPPLGYDSAKMQLEFVHLPAFDRTLARLGITDDELREMQQQILDRPGIGAEIPGTGGVIKLRVALRGRGKRGGARLLYFWLRRGSLIYLLFIYPKRVQENLTPDQLRQIRRMVDDITRE